MESGKRYASSGILSPLLFCFYINNALNKISKMSIWCSVGGVRSNSVWYAVDVCLLAPSAPALQVLLNSINVHFEANNLKINVKKCAYMVFNKAVNSNARIPTIVSLKGEPPERVPKFKYLGVILSEDMIISYDVERAACIFRSVQLDVCQVLQHGWWGAQIYIHNFYLVILWCGTLVWLILLQTC